MEGENVTKTVNLMKGVLALVVVLAGVVGGIYAAGGKKAEERLTIAEVPGVKLAVAAIKNTIENHETRLLTLESKVFKELKSISLGIADINKKLDNVGP